MDCCGSTQPFREHGKTAQFFALRDQRLPSVFWTPCHATKKGGVEPPHSKALRAAHNQQPATSNQQPATSNQHPATNIQHHITPRDTGVTVNE